MEVDSRPNKMGQRRHKMTSTMNNTKSDAGIDSLCPTNPLHPHGSGFSAAAENGGDTEEGYGSSTHGMEKSMSFSITNTRFEFSRLNMCIDISRKVGEISVDDAETLVFFLELVKEALTNERYANA